MAANLDHTFGPKCRLAPVPRSDKGDGLPPIEAQFFYSSVIPIDDPLLTGTVTGGSDSRSPKGQLRPFGRGDNNALEKAWLGLASEEDRRHHEDARTGRRENPDSGTNSKDKRALLVQALAVKHWEKHRNEIQPQDVVLPAAESLPFTPGLLCCSELLMDVSEELEKSFCALARRSDPMLTTESVAREVAAAMNRLRRQSISKSSENPQPLSRTGTPSRPRRGSAAPAFPPPSPRGLKSPVDSTNDIRHGKQPLEGDASFRARPRSQSQATDRSRADTPARHPPADDGISGKPFVRVETLGTQQPSSAASSFPNIVEGTLPKPAGDEDKGYVEAFEEFESKATKKAGAAWQKKYGKGSEEVAVGLSRLHVVSLPNLQMKPIYWSPVNDVAAVMRATWFYRDTMLPVPPTAANQLEAGYHELRPWTETWSDEIRSAIDVGPLGEEKVSHRLWPKDSDSVNQEGISLWQPLIPSDPYCAARCCLGEAASEGFIEPIHPTKAETVNRPFSNYHIIYKNETEAFMLKPSLKPSAYYGRKPIWKIMKGVTVGIPVVRGFDRQAWERIYNRKQTTSKPTKPAANHPHEGTETGTCPACREDKVRGQVTDLILVAHGIGQKFAERVESFNFTHAINGFRRAVNLELGSPIVQQMLREDQNGFMILPLNWRMGLSFEDGGPMREEDKNEFSPDGFGLKDIEPPSIPAIRSMMSDVMFDIPFYMSHHKGKMIQALVSEANRVYRLWCRNNPGFAEKGRVHIIAHSLGSAMAIEILSRQPTSVPRLDLSRPEPENRFLEFDTRNLFLLGSPAGFFLLLERGSLLPRRGRRKPGADVGDTIASNVVGEAGQFGCLAVDNIYNVLAKEDPIAYLLNGAVDATYAASLKPAYLPNASTSLFKSMGDALRTAVGAAPAPTSQAMEPERPTNVRLPSQLELEVHDFTREELAERKAFLLNDNGQIDYYLRSGGGPLEIQYLNMLSAHTSYWTNHDFIRMLCMEIGRPPGRTNTLPAMRAVKATKRVFT